MYKVHHINLPAVQNQHHLQVLSFGCSDPLGAIGIQADLGSFAAMGCHGLTVITAILVGDTTEINDIEPIDAEILIEQARTILEDVPVAAFKLGVIGSVENVTAIAEIVSDYPEVPLIFDPFSSNVPDQGQDTEDIFQAINELIIPQTTLIIASKVEISRLAEAWREPSADDTLALDVQRLIELGCEYVFVMGVGDSLNEITNSLYDQSGIIRNDKWPRINGSFLGAGSTLSGAITALLANGLAMSDAVLEAQEFTNEALAHAQRFGMGKLVPDRYFWAREPDEIPPSDQPRSP
jgi:hydroxymethylpyrimidine/phosphomethylpyrimidine kinase